MPNTRVRLLCSRALDKIGDRTATSQTEALGVGENHKIGDRADKTESIQFSWNKQPTNPFILVNVYSNFNQAVNTSFSIVSFTQAIKAPNCDYWERMGSILLTHNLFKRIFTLRASQSCKTHFENCPLR
jgi:hypothetical protein